MSNSPDVVRVAHRQYIHILDKNTNVQRLEVGPQIFVRKDNERILNNSKPQDYIIIPPKSYCIILNPVERDESNNAVFDEHGMCKLKFGDKEVRLEQTPFPLYPGEEVLESVQKLKVVKKDRALRLTTNENFTEQDGTERVAGDEWIFEGPATYLPRKEVSIIEDLVATTRNKGQALQLRATRETLDKKGQKRVAGQEWLIREPGNYMIGPYEEIVKTISSTVLNDHTALHLKAKDNFTDFLGNERKIGDRWLITKNETNSFIPSVHEELENTVTLITLTSREFCIVENPVDENLKNQHGKKILRKGECSFFLHPDEAIPHGVEDVHVLSEHDGLILRADEEFEDGENGTRQPGDRWMIKGPCEYVPPVEVSIVRNHRSIPLDETEGIYVRDIKSGKVRAVVGETYMLTENEELWEKKLPKMVEELLGKDHDPKADRNRRICLDEDVVNQRNMQHKKSTFRAMQQEVSAAPKVKLPTYEVPHAARVVTLQIPHNAAVQLHDYKTKSARVVFGPDLVLLQPDECFTQLSLSGGKPKKPNQLRSLVLLLGPDFCTDQIVVETADHARLSIQISYNWYFEVSAAKSDQTEAEKLFSIPDFVGDMCKKLASRIRGAIAGVNFDEFHKNSARIIRGSVFGFDRASNRVQDRYSFEENLLNITSVDIQSVEPIDQRTRDSLMKSVQLAIEITTNSQEATAKHAAQEIEQEAKGKLKRKAIEDEELAEKSRQKLLTLQSESAALESTGQAKAEAQSRAESARIEGNAAVEQATLKAQAANIDSEAELKRLTLAREAEIKFQRESNEIEIEKATQIAKIETDKFKEMVACMGADTIKAMASAGQDHQIKLLQSLGLKSTLITDGRNPINLLSTANGFVQQNGPRITEEQEINE